MRSSLVAALLACAASAHAAPEPVVVVSDDLAFHTALAAALAPIGMEVRLASDSPPSSAELATVSRQIADRERAASTVWLVFADAGATLIAYDRGVDRVLVRSLPYAPPLTARQAAEAARTARTMLRALRVTPDTDLPPPRAEAAPGVRARALQPDPAPPRAGDPDRAGVLAIDLDGGMRVRGPGATAAPAGSLGVIWRPDRLGVAVAVRLARPADVTGPLMGRISDHSVAVSLRLPLRPWRERLRPGDLGVIAAGGVALHRVDLAGALGPTPIRETRLDPALRLGLTASYAVSPAIGVGLAVSGDWLLRRQAYAAGPAEVLAVPAIQIAVGLSLIARIL